jgi:hypothetical protein
MVDVVEAMIGLGPASAAQRPSASRLRSSTSGTPSKMISAQESAVCAAASGTIETRAIRVSTAAGSNRPKLASVASTVRTSSSASADSFSNADSSRDLKSTSETWCPA